MTDEPRTPQPPAERDRPAAAAGGPPPAAAGARPPQRPAKPRAGWVFVGALGAFFAALTLLAFQVRAGQDPALGPAQPVAQVQKAKPRRVLIRKVIKRIVIHHPPSGSSAAAPAPTPAAPQTTTSASAPAPAPAPAPAAPAPLTTQSS